MNYLTYKKLIPLLLLQLVLFTHCADSSSEIKVIGGTIAPKYNWFAGLEFNSGQIPGCGGTFIDARVVLTAAHCVVDLDRTLRIRPGTNSDESGLSPTLKVEAVIPHPDYSPSLMQNDIALLIVEDYDQSIWQIETLPINEDSFFPADNLASKVTVVGRGNQSSFGFLHEDTVRELTVPVIEQHQCKRVYNEHQEMITNDQLCAGQLLEGGFDSCQGDSGGPLIATQDDSVTYVVGIVSWGHSCAQAQKPGVYTRVSQFGDWIEATKKVFLEAPSQEQYSGARLAKFVQAYCYTQVFTRKQLITVPDNSQRLGLLQWSFNSDEDFQETSDEASFETPKCSFSTAGDFSFKVAVDEVDRDLLIQNVGSRKVWKSDYIEEKIESTFICRDKLGLEATVAAAGWGSVTTEQGSYSFWGDGQQWMNPNAFKITCDIEDYNLTFAIQNDPVGGMQYLLKVAGNEFGEGGDTYLLRPDVDYPPEVTVGIATDETLKSGTLEVFNNSQDDIFTWEIECSFRFLLVDKFGVKFDAAEKELVSLGSHTDSFALRFVHPVHSHGTIRVGSSSEKFTLVLETEFSQASECRINGSIVAMQW